jgi:integrase
MAQRITARLLQSKTPGVFNDSIVPGLRFIIAARTRTFRVSPRIGGTQRNIKVYAVTASSLKEAGEQLAEARDKARNILHNAAKGIDPQEALQAAKLEAARARRDTFASVAADYMTEHGQHLKSAHELRRKLDVDILPALGDIPVADVRRADIKALFLNRAETKPVAANRMLALIRVVLNYAIDEELIEANPAARIKLRRETPRDRYLSEAEIRGFWNGLGETGADPQIKRILKLLLVTGQRRGEVTGMRWAEVDIGKAVWEIPADRTKAGRPHRVPLSPLALDLLGEPHGSEYVFGNGGGRPFSPGSVSLAMHREREALGLTERATVHDLRRTAATHLGDLGIDRLVIGKLLNHAEQGVTGRVYDLGAYAEPKRLAMAAWSNKIMEIVTGKAAPENVVPIKGAVG